MDSSVTPTYDYDDYDKYHWWSYYRNFPVYVVVVIFQGKYKQAKEAYEQFINSEDSSEDTYKATANKQLGNICNLIYN